VLVSRKVSSTVEETQKVAGGGKLEPDISLIFWRLDQSVGYSCYP
jgi:hypothetical protein